jgi:tight adherence protein B
MRWGAELPDRLLGWLPGRARRRRERQTEDFITLLRQSAALLQAGRRPQDLWAELAGLHEPCRSGTQHPGCCLHHALVGADAAVLLGRPPWHAAAGPGEGRHWEQLAGCLAVSREAGVPLAGLLERLADALEDGQDAHQAREAASAGPKSTARLLGLLPVAGLGLSALVGAPPTDLLTGALGWLVVGTGVALAVVGHLWTRALARRAEDGA